MLTVARPSPIAAVTSPPVIASPLERTASAALLVWPCAARVASAAPSSARVPRVTLADEADDASLATNRERTSVLAVDFLRVAVAPLRPFVPAPRGTGRGVRWCGRATATQLSERPAKSVGFGKQLIESVLDLLAKLVDPELHRIGDSSRPRTSRPLNEFAHSGHPMR